MNLQYEVRRKVFELQNSLGFCKLYSFLPERRGRAVEKRGIEIEALISVMVYPNDE